jgi:hypothetical protein
MLGLWSASVICVTVAGTTGPALPSSLPAIDLALSFPVSADELAAIARQVLALGKTWVLEGYARAPAVMLGLGAALLVPPLAVAGLILSGRTHGPAPAPPEADLTAAWPEPAWLEIGERNGELCPIDRDLIQIGRHSDNDIRLDDATVHRYHALIERKAGSGYTIADVSGPEGSGVRVNGRRVGIASLANGDLVELGAARLRFATDACGQE